jgi:hypothetical protein
VASTWSPAETTEITAHAIAAIPLASTTASSAPSSAASRASTSTWLGALP